MWKDTPTENYRKPEGSVESDNAMLFTEDTPGVVVGNCRSRLRGPVIAWDLSLSFEEVLGHLTAEDRVLSKYFRWNLDNQHPSSHEPCGSCDEGLLC